MPIEFFVDAGRRVVFTVAGGAFSIGDAIGHMDRLRADPAFSPAFNQLADFRDVTEVELSGLDVRTLAQQVVFSPSSYRALIITKGVAFGLARMFATLREIAGEPNLKIVGDMEQAADWVSVDRDAAEAACAAIKQRLKTSTDGNRPTAR